MKYLFIMLVQTSSIISAQWQDAISGNAILDSLHQEVSKFYTIEVLGPFEITLKKGNRHNITIVGESNLIPHVEFDVNKNKLVLRTSNNRPSSLKGAENRKLFFTSHWIRTSKHQLF